MKAGYNEIIAKIKKYERIFRKNIQIDYYSHAALAEIKESGFLNKIANTKNDFTFKEDS